MQDFLYTFVVETLLYFSCGGCGLASIEVHLIPMRSCSATPAKSHLWQRNSSSGRSTQILLWKIAHRLNVRMCVCVCTLSNQIIQVSVQAVNRCKYRLQLRCTSYKMSDNVKSHLQTSALWLHTRYWWTGQWLTKLTQVLHLCTILKAFLFGLNLAVMRLSLQWRSYDKCPYLHSLSWFDLSFICFGVLFYFVEL